MGKAQNIYKTAIKYAGLILSDRQNLDLPHFRALLGYNLNVVDYKTLLILTNALESLGVFEIVDGVVCVVQSKKEVSQ